MTDRSTGPNDDTRSSDELPPTTPRWVKVSLITVGVLVLIALVAMLGGENHGPSRHFDSAPLSNTATDLGAVGART